MTTVCKPQRFYSVRHRLYFLSGDYSLRVPTVFIPFTTRCILNAQFVGLTGFYSVYRRICFPSRRLGKQIRCFYRFLSTSTYWLSRFLSKAHPVAPYNIQGLYNSLSSVFRLLLIEAITFPFHRQKSKYSLSISLSPRSIFCNNRLLRNFLLSPSTLYGPTL